MAKFHIKKDGTPGQCRAKAGNCPLGGADSHFETEGAALEASQKILEKKFGLDTTHTGPKIINGPLTDRDEKAIENLTLDGVKVQANPKPGLLTEFEFTGFGDRSTFIVSKDHQKSDNVNQFLEGKKPEPTYTVRRKNKVSRYTETQLNQQIKESMDYKGPVILTSLVKEKDSETIKNLDLPNVDVRINYRFDKESSFELTGFPNKNKKIEFIKLKTPQNSGSRVKEYDEKFEVRENRETKIYTNEELSTHIADLFNKNK